MRKFPFDMKKTKVKKQKKWLEPRSIRFDRDKLTKATEMGTIKELSAECRKALDKLIGQ
jgi:hypothetical protein